VRGRRRHGKLSTIKRDDGTMHVTYNGHPLYFYGGDGEAGQTNGQGIYAYGNRWYAVNPAS
jgi:predicted lipoprotein with Yx(FWY)xxD motif